jgi:ferritin-like metal-binding protein YciE
MKTNPLEKLGLLEKKIEKMVKKMTDLKSENEMLNAELKFHEKNTGRQRSPQEFEEYGKQKKKVKAVLEGLLEKFSENGI